MALDPFSILGLPRRFDLDAAAIQRAYLARAANVHPDLVEHGAEAGPDSAMLNLAKRVLEDPELRADALVVLLGGPTRETDRGLPEGFLMDIMEARENLESARTSGDTAAAAELEAWATDRRRSHIQSVGAKLTSLTGQPSAAALAGIRRELNAWRYIERMLEQLHETGPA